MRKRQAGDRPELSKMSIEKRGVNASADLIDEEPRIHSCPAAFNGPQRRTMGSDFRPREMKLAPKQCL